MVASSPSPGPNLQRFVKEGQGWRIGWNGAAPTYQGLLGGEWLGLRIDDYRVSRFLSFGSAPGPDHGYHGYRVDG